MNLLSLPGIENVTQGFIDKLQGMSTLNGWDPLGLGYAMSFESRFKTAAKNPYSTATGLIQFTEPTANELGTSTAALRNMSAIDQLDYVEKFFKRYMTKVPTRPEDYELIVLGQSGMVGASDDTVVFPGGSAGYTGNAMV